MSSSSTPSVSLSLSASNVEGVEEQDVRKTDDTKLNDEQDLIYSDDFEVEKSEDELATGGGGGGSGGNLTKAFSFEEDTFLPEEEEDEPLDSADIQLSISAMSTIDEEEKSKSVSNKESRVPDELKGLVHHFQGGGGDSGSDMEEDASEVNPSVQSHSQSISQEDDADSGMEALLKKLKLLENTQNLLENVLDANNLDDKGTENVELVLQQALSQLDFTSRSRTKKSRDQEQEDQSELDDYSLNQEMDSLRKLLDDSSLMIDQDGDGEGGAMLEPGKSGREERQIAEVLQEYEELERSLYSVSGKGQGQGSRNSCDEHEFLKNEAVGKPKVVPTTTPSSVTESPWEEERKKVEEFQFVSQPVSRRESNSEHDQSQNQSADINSTQQESPLSPNKLRLELEESTLLDLNQFMMEDGGGDEQIRSRTKTIPKKKYPTSAKSASATSFSSVQKSTSARPRPVPGSPYLAKHQQRASGSGVITKHKESQSTSSIPQQTYETVTPKRGITEAFGGHSGDQLKQPDSIKELEEAKERISNLQNELSKQESLLQAYQEDNQKLYSALKIKESEYGSKEAEWEELMNSLKTEIATLKIQRFGSPSRPGSATSTSGGVALIQKQHKVELDRVKEESAYKSEQMIELRKEIIGLRNNLSEVQLKVKNPSKNSKLIFEEKEKEWQKQVRGLTKQVRTLQKILYNKDPNNPAVSSICNLTGDDFYNSSQDITSNTGTPAKTNNKQPQMALLEERVLELEQTLSQADADAKDRLKDFQMRLNSLKSKYDEQLKEYELQLEESASKIKLLENSVSSDAISELKTKLDRSQGEVAHLKHDLSRTKRELEIAARSSLPPNNASVVAKQDAGTLSLAIKSFKVELAEKEKEIVRLKKDLGELQRTNGTLKREREKYLSSLNIASGLHHANPNTNLGNPRILSRVPSGNVNLGLGGRGNMAPVRNVNLKNTNIKETKDSKHFDSPNKQTGATNATVELLQQTLDYERSEFGMLMSRKKKDIEERDYMIQKLRKQLDETRDPSNTNEDVDLSEELRRKDVLLEELRSRLTSQNELILRLKEYLSHCRGLEEQVTSLSKELEASATQVQQLTQKLQLVQVLNRPENEILTLLATKFEELNSRYLAREHQMGLLLNKLSVRTGAATSTCSLGGGTAGGNRSGTSIAKPSLSVIEQLLLNWGSSSSTTSSTSSSDLDLRQLSPSLYAHLFTGGSLGADFPEV